MPRPAVALCLVAALTAGCLQDPADGNDLGSGVTEHPPSPGAPQPTDVDPGCVHFDVRVVPRALSANETATVTARLQNACDGAITVQGSSGSCSPRAMDAAVVFEGARWALSRAGGSAVEAQACTDDMPSAFTLAPGAAFEDAWRWNGTFTRFECADGPCDRTLPAPADAYTVVAWLVQARDEVTGEARITVGGPTPLDAQERLAHGSPYDRPDGDPEEQAPALLVTDVFRVNATGDPAIRPRYGGHCGPAYHDLGSADPYVLLNFWNASEPAPEGVVLRVFDAESRRDAEEHVERSGISSDGRTLDPLTPGGDAVAVTSPFDASRVLVRLAHDGEDVLLDEAPLAPDEYRDLHFEYDVVTDSGTLHVDHAVRVRHVGDVDVHVRRPPAGCA